MSIPEGLEVGKVYVKYGEEYDNYVRIVDTGSDEYVLCGNLESGAHADWTFPISRDIFATHYQLAPKEYQR